MLARHLPAPYYFCSRAKMLREQQVHIDCLHLIFLFGCKHVTVCGALERPCIDSQAKHGIQPSVRLWLQVTDLHRHFIDKLTIPDAAGTGVLRRVDEVFDCWFESGSMPYGQVHYPFEQKQAFEEQFPADFVAEGVPLLPRPMSCGMAGLEYSYSMSGVELLCMLQAWQG